MSSHPMLAHKDALVSTTTSSVMGAEYEAENPMFAGGPILSIEEALRQNRLVAESIYSVKDISTGKFPRLSSITRREDTKKDVKKLLEAAVESSRQMTRALQGRLDTITDEVLDRLEAVEKAMAEPTSYVPSVETDLGDTWAVVLTFNPDYVDCRGKTAEEIRKRSLHWIQHYIEKHKIDVVGGPWMDDSGGMSQPHLNMTIRPKEVPVKEFKFWQFRKGYVYTSPVVNEENWAAYSMRNHETCTAYMMGDIDKEEAVKRILSKQRVKGVRGRTFPSATSASTLMTASTRSSMSKVMFDPEDDYVKPPEIPPVLSPEITTAGDDPDAALL